MKNNGKIKIEKGVEMPQPSYKKIFPFIEMSVGDSFFVKDIPPKRVQDGMAAFVRCKAGAGRKFALRSVDGGVRVWRIE